MSTTHRLMVVGVCLLFTGCAEQAPPVERPAEQPSPVEASEPSAAVARADAMLAEMASREAQFKQIEHDMAQRRAATQEPRAPAMTAPAMPSAPPPVPTAAPTTAPALVANEKDEAWWKDRARTIGLRLEDAERQAAAAAVAFERTTLRITQDQARADYLAKVAAINSLKAELESLQEDARRANVPPGWLRWP